MPPTRIQLLQQRRYHKCIRLICPEATKDSVLEEEFRETNLSGALDSPPLEVWITLGGLTKTNPLNLMEMLFFSRHDKGDGDSESSIRIHRRLTKRLGPQCFHHCAVKYKSSILLIGGHTISKFRRRILDNVLEFNLVSNKWRRWGKTGSEHPCVAGHTAVLMNYSATDSDTNCEESVILVFGGENNRSQRQDGLWCLQSSTQTWKRIECLEKPSPRWLHSAVVTSSPSSGAQMWIFGGDNSVSHQKESTLPEEEDTNPTMRNENIFDDLWYFTLDTLQWKRIAKPMNVSRSFRAEEYSSAESLSRFPSTEHHIPPHEHSPRNVPALSYRFWPSARHSHAACYFEAQCENGDFIPPCMIIYGGYTGQASQLGSSQHTKKPPESIPFSNELLRFDFASETWHRFAWKDTAPRPLSSHDMVADGNSLVVFGGFDGQRDLKSTYRIVFATPHDAYIEDFDSTQHSSVFPLPHTPISGFIGYPSLDDMPEQKSLSSLPSRKKYQISTHLSSTVPIRMNPTTDHRNQLASFSQSLRSGHVADRDQHTRMAQKLRDEMIKFRNVNTRLENEVDQLRQQLREKEAAISISEDESAQVAQSLEEELQKTDMLQRQLQSFKNEVDARVEQEQDLTRRIRDKDTSLSLLKDQVEEYTEKFNTLQKENQSKLDEQEDEIHELQKELRNREGRISALSQLSEQQQQDIENYRLALSGQSIASPRKQQESTELNDTLKLQIQMLEQQHRNLCSNLDSKSTEIEKLKKMLQIEKEKSADRNTLSDQKHRAEERMKNMELQVDSLRHLLQDQKERTRKAKEKSKKLHRKYSKQKKKYREELTATKSHIAMLVHLVLKSQDLPSHTKANIFKQLQTWKLDAKLIQEREFLGSGSFGAVFRGFYNKDEVAIKVIKGESLGLSRSLMHDKVLKEVLIMRSVNHENILQCHGCCFSEEDAKIVLEYCPMNLSQLLRKQTLSAERKLSLIQQLASGLQVLHANKIKHRDLKPQNILIQQSAKQHDHQYEVKICDFGESIMQTMARTLVGTVGYGAPEIFLQLPYDHRVDIYSFGITCFEIWAQENPFKRWMEQHRHVRNADQLFRIIVEEEIRPNVADERLNDMPQELQNLMQACWDSNPLNRPQNMDEVRRVLSECEIGAAEEMVGSNAFSEEDVSRV
uniref:Protein kinase domain-containing protein n=1 Tax=Percolomonas cosmopolitus TaxID=63605 RepID=A0A6U0KNQ1_9EUKA|mmetsp:Transcript_4055/g.15249  ORF Transcript_4055/g.15249 Transcript_4055/m.15249 type:complete len:1159 (+) Transcript_4055:208-3684(+)